MGGKGAELKCEIHVWRCKQSSPIRHFYPTLHLLFLPIQIPISYTLTKTKIESPNCNSKILSSLSFKMPSSELSCSSYSNGGPQSQPQAPPFSFSSNSSFFVSGGLFLEPTVSKFLLRSVSMAEEQSTASSGVLGSASSSVCRSKVVAGGRFLSVSLRSDGIVQETNRCLVQNGYEGSEDAVVEKKKKKKEKTRVRSGAAMNTTKHLWAGAIAAMVSRYMGLILLRLNLIFQQFH